MNPRPADRMREVTIEPFDTGAPGSVLVSFGQTRVLCTASVASDPPPWLPREPVTGRFLRGWVTAEYAMLPGSTPTRKPRKADGRGTEIQRLIGRSLRAAVDLEAMPGLSVTVDCDVLKADGGTRTAAITGGWVALALALDHARARGTLERDPLTGAVAAVSVGLIDGVPTLDLDYPLDVRAEVDLNVVAKRDAGLVEVQGTGEHGTFSRCQLNALLDLAEAGIDQLFEHQRKARG